jgi:hypothetical protein
VLKIIFEQKRDAVVQGLRKLHNMDLHNLHFWPNVIRTMETTIWAEHVARMEAKRNVLKILVASPDGRRPVGRPICKCQDNIKMDL